MRKRQPRRCGGGSMPVRPLAHETFEALMLDVWPGHAAVVDFGIADTAHYAALQEAVRSGKITEEGLDALLGDGPGLTAACGGGVTFTTPYDGM